MSKQTKALKLARTEGEKHMSLFDEYMGDGDTATIVLEDGRTMGTTADKVIAEFIAEHNRPCVIRFCGPTTAKVFGSVAGSHIATVVYEELT